MIFRTLQSLQEFDFQVVHRPGEKQGNADGLSRQSSKAPELIIEEQKRLLASGWPHKLLMVHWDIFKWSLCQNVKTYETTKN